MRHRCSSICECCQKLYELEGCSTVKFHPFKLIADVLLVIHADCLEAHNITTKYLWGFGIPRVWQVLADALSTPLRGEKTNLAPLSIENEETEKADFEHIIDQFCISKSKKGYL